MAEGSVQISLLQTKWPSVLRDVTEGNELKVEAYTYTHLPRTWCQEYLQSDIEHYVLHGRTTIYLTRADYEDARSITNVMMRYCEVGEESRGHESGPNNKSKSTV